MAKRTTIGDVAAAAGVSVATVSRVLNGLAVRESTATKVSEAADRLQYTPNALTKSVFAGHSRTIGVVIEDQSSPFYLDLMRGIDEVAASSGSLVMFASTFRHADREAAQIQTMDEHRVRGLIVTTGASTDYRTRRMAQNGTPCVIVARSVDDPPPGLHTVSLDNRKAGRMMATHLAACGRKSIGVIAGGNRPSQIERTDGLRQGLVELGLPLPEAAVATAATGEEVEEALDALLERARARQAPLDALVCHTGRLTLAAHAALIARGITIPDDLAFLTMDDFPWGEALGISVIAQPSFQMGKRAAELLVESSNPSVQLIFEPTLIARTSCGEGE